jgi:hypothetical protein
VSRTATLQAEVSAWAKHRNAAGTVDWQFTTEDARINLHALLSLIAGVTEHPGSLGVK